METIARGIEGLATLFARLAGIMVVLIAIGVAVDVLTRNVTGQTVLNSYEFSTYLFAIAVSFGMSYTALTGAHIRVDVLYARFPDPVRRFLDFLSFVSLAALGLFLAWYSVRLTLKSLDRGVTSSSAIAFPLGIPQGVWAIGFVVFALTCLFLAVRHAAFMVAGRGEDADRLGHFGQDEEVAEAVTHAKEWQG